MSTITVRRLPATLTHAAVSLSASGDLVAAVAGKKLLIAELLLTNTNSGVTVKFQSGSDDLSGAMTLDAFRALGAGLPAAPANSGSNGFIPLYETAVGEAFKIALSGTTMIAGHVRYWTDDN
jgi:hypothetical protein